ncbi:transcription factor S [Candidatus Pacearchaeota archaeon]|nr:transcription factor S [Candidatus Pacearchaeota archaeon]
MEFCPKCGAVLIQKIKNAGCPRCKYSAKGKLDITSSEEIKEKKPATPVVKGKEIDVNPIVNEDCIKCESDKCYFWEIQTRASDESPTKFFKCVKCGHTRREYR